MPSKKTAAPGAAL
jgi:hypothetical protein